MLVMNRLLPGVFSGTVDAKNFTVPAPVAFCSCATEEAFEEVKWQAVALLAGEEWEKVCVADVGAAKNGLMSGDCDLFLSAPITADLMPGLEYSQPTFSGACFQGRCEMPRLLVFAGHSRTSSPRPRA